ncbi:MAG TPA: MFS transporter [Solirubrobacteraceae bacterium]|jgi:predicted MFS family arabinose efflux permease|nr:MFS transporter [Solirubrobacteraceae bacterium]
MRSPQLRRIIGAYTVNRVGTWLGIVAMLVAVFDHTHSALAVSAFLLAGQALPAFVVPVIVARVEASKRRSELSGLYVFEAIVTALLAVLLWHFWLPGVLLLAALDGTAALTASALLRAEVAKAARAEVEAQAAADAPVGEPVTHAGREVEKRAGGKLEQAVQEAERRANAALNVAFSATFVLGPAISGAIVASAGASAALFIDVGSFLICGALLLDLHPHVEEAGGESVASRLRAAWRHINEVPSLRGLLLLETVALIFFESAGPIEVTYAKATLHAGDRGLGLLLTVWGSGGVLGSIVFARMVKRSLGIMLSAGALAIGAAYVGFSAAPSLALACCAAFVGGIGNGLQWPSLISLVQKLTPPQLLGRMMGAVESMGALCLAFGLLLGGALAALSSPRIAFLVVGVGAVATTVVFLRITPGGMHAEDDELRPEAVPGDLLEAHEPLPRETSSI